MARRRKEFLTWRPDDHMREVAKKVSREYRKMGGKGGAVSKANYAAIKWMEGVAVSNLTESIKTHGRPQTAATGKLARVIRQDDSHTWNNRGWKFMVAAKVEAKIPYAYSLEYGYSGNVGKYRWFLFLGRGKKRADQFNRVGDTQVDLRTAHKRNVARSTDLTRGVRSKYFGNKGKVADRIVGRREQTGIRKGVKESEPLRASYFNKQGSWVRVQIKRPIPAYHYGTKAGYRFDKENIYLRMLENVKKDLEKAGTDTELLLGPAAKSTPKKPKTAKKRAPKKFSGKGFGRNAGSGSTSGEVTTRQIGE